MVTACGGNVRRDGDTSSLIGHRLETLQKDDIERQ
jgi:hypothetical protein